MKHEWIVLLAFAALPAVASLAASSYQVSALPVPTMTYGTDSLVGDGATSLNGVLQIAYSASYQGPSLNDPVITTPFILQGDQFIALPVSPGIGDSAGPAAINSAGTTVGAAWSSLSPFVQYPVMWSGGSVTALPLGGYSAGTALCINNAGQIGGYTILGSAAGKTLTDAVWWDTNGTLHDSGTFGGTSSAVLGINNNGQMLILVSSPGSSETYIWDHGITQPVASSGMQLNDLGHVLAADQNAAGYSQGLFWNGSTCTVLPDLDGALGTIYSGLNDSDQAVGSSIGAGGQVENAIIWDHGTLYNLNSLVSANSGWVLTSASAIGPDGSILGTGYLNGEFRYYLASPTGVSSSDPTPEPATAGLLLLGGTLQLGRRRRKA